MASRSAPPGTARRTGCLAFVVLWVCVASLSVIAGLLAARGDIVIHHGDLRQTRLWLVREVGERGLGLSSARLASGGESEGEACIETTVRYLMWQTVQGVQNTSYCECYTRQDTTWDYRALC